jgi:hypothetical protein
MYGVCSVGGGRSMTTDTCSNPLAVLIVLRRPRGSLSRCGGQNERRAVAKSGGHAHSCSSAWPLKRGWAGRAWARCRWRAASTRSPATCSAPATTSRSRRAAISTAWRATMRAGRACRWRGARRPLLLVHAFRSAHTPLRPLSSLERVYAGVLDPSRRGHGGLYKIRRWAWSRRARGHAHVGGNDVRRGPLLSASRLYPARARPCPGRRAPRIARELGRPRPRPPRSTPSAPAHRPWRTCRTRFLFYVCLHERARTCERADLEWMPRLSYLGVTPRFFSSPQKWLGR